MPGSIPESMKQEAINEGKVTQESGRPQPPYPVKIGSLRPPVTSLSPRIKFGGELAILGSDGDRVNT